MSPGIDEPLAVEVKEIPWEGYSVSCESRDYHYYAAEVLGKHPAAGLSASSYDETLSCDLTGSPSVEDIHNAVDAIIGIMEKAAVLYAAENAAPATA